eukprot:TRINITY_DN67058_c0_g1_i1.p2 TRINITY_DN67058_c0_g1~~TRINITY_DN67058_c0_g1_i1.p2  ORF type:complete len:262 (-),score=100.20 TRINITY_DN67058_c0_g1_i1:337-1122(-)
MATIAGFGLASASSGSKKGSGAGQRQHQKRGRKEERDAMDNEEDESCDVTQLIGLVSRLAMSASHKADTAICLSTDMLLVSAAAKAKTSQGEVILADVVKKSQKEYQQEAAAKSSGKEKEEMGPPYVRTWEAILMWAAAEMKGANDQEGEHAIMTVMKEVQEAGDLKAKVEHVCRSVRMCKMSKAFKKDTYKLEVVTEKGVDGSMAVQQAWKKIMHMLTSRHGAIRKHGPPPVSNLQRQTLKQMKKMNIVREDDDNSKRGC